MIPGNEKYEKFALLFAGLAWIIVGIQTLFEPIYYFRGAYVDFTGYNKLVGSGLIIVGIACIYVFFRKKPKP